MKNLKWLLPPALAVFVWSLNAQVSTGFKQLDDKEYEEALTTFNALVNDKEEGVAAQWGIAKVLSDPEFTNHDYDSSFVLKSKVEQLLRKNKNDKQKKKWDKKYDLNPESLKLLGKTLPDLRWKEINAKGNLENLDRFVELYKKTAVVKIRKEAEKQQAAVLRATANGSATTYRATRYLLHHHEPYILDSFPGRFELLNAELFTTYLREKGNSVDQVAAFMAENPRHKISQYSARANFDVAQKANTTKSYLAFLAATKGSPFDEYVYNRVAELIGKQPLVADEKNKLSQDEQWLVEDIQSGTVSGVRVFCGTKYDGKGLAQWKIFIKRHAGQTCGSDALRSTIQFAADARDWTSVVTLIDELGSFFPEQAGWYKNMRQIAAAPDNNARPVMLKNKISTTAASEYLPAVTSDGKTLAFCGRSRSDGSGGEDIFIAERKDSVWSEPKMVRELCSNEGHEAPLCFTADGNTLVAFKNGKVFLSDRNATGWGPLKAFPVDLSRFDWVADVHFVPGEQRVFFAAQGDGAELVDIYMAAKDENEVWSAPKKLGAPINSSGIDRSPFIHPDQRTLYFSSVRNDGLGLLDVYKTERLDDTWENWSEPVNLGKNINNSADNWGYIVSTDGSTAYFSAKAEGKTQDDIFYIEVPASMRPKKEVKQLAVEVRDDKGKPMPGVNVELRNTRTGAMAGQYRTPPSSGKVMILLPEGEEFTISGIKSGFLCNPVTLDIANSKTNTATVILTLTPVKDVIGKKTDINADILFDLAKSELKPEAAAQIRFLAEFAKREKLTLELGGFTDPSGSDEDNLKLSQARADAVRTALIGAGIKEDNITATGYGETSQVCKEATPECYQKNRRVEIKWK